MNDPFKVHQPCELKDPHLIVGWQTQDAGKIGIGVTNFLKEQLGAEEIGEVEPRDFFTWSEVSFRGDVVHVPEHRFWACKRASLLLFESDTPNRQWYQFLAALLDFAEYHCHIKDLCIVRGVVSHVAHTHPRQIFTVANQPQLVRQLARRLLRNPLWSSGILA